jgi:hypothetical protein
MEDTYYRTRFNGARRISPTEAGAAAVTDAAD